MRDPAQCVLHTVGQKNPLFTFTFTNHCRPEGGPTCSCEIMTLSAHPKSYILHTRITEPWHGSVPNVNGF